MSLTTPLPKRDAAPRSSNLRVHSADPTPWNLDTLDADFLRAAWLNLTTFVDWLHTEGIDIPRCWYVHGWVVRRLLALQHWHADSYASLATARQAAEWWSLGLRPLIQDWADLQGHRGSHPPADRPWAAPISLQPLDEFIEQAVELRRGQAK